MLADAGCMAAASCALFLALAPAAGAAPRANLGDLCAENGADPVTEDTLVLHTTEAIESPFFCVINLVDASLRVVGSQIDVASLSIVRSGAGAVTITGTTIEAEAAFSIVGGAGPVRIVHSTLSGTNNSEIEISGDILIRHGALSLDTLSSATFLTFASQDGKIEIVASNLSARANSFGLITLRAPQSLVLRSSEVVAEATELAPQGGNVSFVNNEVAAGSPASGGPAVVSLPAHSTPGRVVVVGNAFAAGAAFRFEAGVEADRCVIETNEPEAAVVGTEDACP